MTQDDWDEVLEAVQQLTDVCERLEPDPESADDTELLLAVGDHLIALALMVRHKRTAEEEDAPALLAAAPAVKRVSH